MIVIINETVSYDSDKSFENQTFEFQNYMNNLYTKTPYPEFDNEGAITYNYTDSILNYSVKRIQEKPFSTSYRSVKEQIINIEII